MHDCKKVQDQSEAALFMVNWLHMIKKFDINYKAKQLNYFGIKNSLCLKRRLKGDKAN